MIITKTQRIKIQEELLQIMAVYISLVVEENRELVSLAYTDGWRSTKEKIKLGQDCRKKITELTNKLGWK